MYYPWEIRDMLKSTMWKNILGISLVIALLVVIGFMVVIPNKTYSAILHTEAGDKV